jgi:hypothetical protein
MISLAAERGTTTYPRYIVYNTNSISYFIFEGSTVKFQRRAASVLYKGSYNVCTTMNDTVRAEEENAREIFIQDTIMFWLARDHEVAVIYLERPGQKDKQDTDRQEETRENQISKLLIGSTLRKYQYQQVQYSTALHWYAMVSVLHGQYCTWYW